MGTALPIDIGDIDEPHVRLMHQSGRLQRVLGPLFSHVLFGDLPELAVDERQESVGRFAIAGVPIAQDPGNFTLRHFCRSL